MSGRGAGACPVLRSPLKQLAAEYLASPPNIRQRRWSRGRRHSSRTSGNPLKAGGQSRASLRASALVRQLQGKLTCRHHLRSKPANASPSLVLEAEHALSALELNLQGVVERLPAGSLSPGAGRSHLQLPGLSRWQTAIVLVCQARRAMAGGERIALVSVSGGHGATRVSNNPGAVRCRWSNAGGVAPCGTAPLSLVVATIRAARRGLVGVNSPARRVVLFRQSGRGEGEGGAKKGSESDRGSQRGSLL